MKVRAGDDPCSKTRRVINLVQMKQARLSSSKERKERDGKPLAAKLKHPRRRVSYTTAPTNGMPVVLFAKERWSSSFDSMQSLYRATRVSCEQPNSIST